MRHEKLAAHFMTAQLAGALERRDVAAALDCLENGARAQAKDADGAPLVFTAIRNGDLDVLQAMIAAGARLNDTDKLGFAALDYAQSLYAETARRERTADHAAIKHWDSRHAARDGWRERGDGRYYPHSRKILRLLEKSGARAYLSADPAPASTSLKA